MYVTITADNKIVLKVQLIHLRPSCIKKLHLDYLQPVDVAQVTASLFHTIHH